MSTVGDVTGGSQLKEWLRKKKKTQVWLAARLRLSQGTVSALIRDEVEPKASVAVDIERITGIRVDSWLRTKRAS
jgi:transcriptional regulator with XRE-family HTH domain